MVYKSEFAKWKEYMNYLASLSPASPMANVRQGATDHLLLPASTSLAKSHFRVDPHLATSCAANVSTPNDSSLLPAYPTAPFLADSSQGIIRLKTLPEGALPTKLFLQLNVEDLGVCLPITVVQPNPQPMGVDSRTALVLTLDRSRISACYRDSFVGQGEFTDFCLRFDDDFNVGSDDWKPDWRRASVDVQSKHYSLILNACVVPSGTFNVCSHDPDKCAQWNLLVQWQMRGLDFHLDDNIGRRLKALISVLTRITGYDGAAPLLPTSAEEEEEGEYVEGSHVQRELSGLAETDNVSAKDESLSKQIRNANRTSISIVGTQQSVLTHEPSRKHGGYSDIASLDRYRPGGCPPESVANMPPFDLSQVRSMELHKHQQELIEAQCCLAFKRQKWDTLRRKKGITMQRSPVFLHDPTKPPGATAYSNIESQGLMNDRIPRSSVVADLSSTSVSNSDVHGPNVHRASIVSKDESLYFDTGSCEVTTQQVSEASENGRNNPSSCHLTNDHCSNQDLWFDPQEAVSFSEAGFPFSDGNFLTATEEQAEGEPSEYNSSDEAEEHNGVKLASRPPHDKSRVLFGDLSNGIRDIGTQPKVLLQVNVHIHIDSGCCVLHPRLPQDVLSTSVDLYSPIHPNVVPAQYRFQTPNTVASRPQTELGGRFSNSDLLGAYLERYKKHLLQDTQFLSTDLSVFLLPAVDVGLHYNSVTEVDFRTSPIPTSPSVPPTSPQTTSTTVSGATLLPNQPTIVHSPSLRLGSLRTNAHGTLGGKQPINTTIPESKVSTTNPHEFNVGHTSAIGNSGLKKQTDLFVSFFLQKLPKELIVHPALLDFLEQALESMPLLADWEVESASISSDGVQVEDKRNNASASHSAPLDTRFWETFPVHTVVHLHVQPLTVRFLCLPTSRMQCLMSLPFLDVIFSTNRSELGGDADSSPTQNETRNRMLATSGENRDSSDPRPTEKCNKSTEVVDETLEPEVFSSQPADTSEQKMEHPTAINVDRCPPARTRCFSLATSSVAHWPPEIPNSDKSYKPKRRSTMAKPRWSRDALDPTANNFLSVKSCKGVTSASIPEHKSGVGRDIPTPGNLPSLSTTLMTERGTTAAATPNSSMRVASWHALPIFCVHLKRFELNLFIGSAMGQTRLTMDELFFDGRISLHSSGRKNTILSTGLGTCQFISEGGGVGGEICLLNADAKVCLDEDPTRDPLHSLDSRIGGFQLRIEYMSTNILLMRVSSLTLRLRDEWKLKDTARFIFERSQTAIVLTSTQLARSSLTNASTTGGCSYTPIEPQILESEVGAPPVYIRVVGEINWDQAQTAVVRTTTPDLIRSIRKVRDYFEEQVREGRMSLIGQTGSFGLLASRNSSVFRPMVSAESGCARSQNAVVERTIIDKLLQRHWQHLLCESYNVYVREQLTVNPNFQPLSNPLSDMDGQLFPVLGGSLQLTGRSLGIACFAGSFRSAPDWAVFNIQYPTACFETEAQREAHDSSLISSDPSESDGWINVRQVLSFDLGSQPEFRPQMAYVLRVRRGSQPNTRNPPTLTIAEWMEFTFRGADNTVAQFPIQFPDSAAGVATVIDDQTHTFGVVRETSPSDTTSVSTYSLGQSLRNPSINNSKREHSSSSVAASMSNTLRHNLHPITAQLSALPRPHPLKPPVEGEILFILPSISLRITTDQRQTMAQPTLCSLSSVLPKHSAESASSSSTAVTSGARSWIYGRKTVLSSLPQGDSVLTAAPSCSSQFTGLIDSGPVSSTGTMSDNLTTRLRELATTSSPMVQDARIYEIVHWSLSPMCRWLLASNIGVPAFDRLLENIGFRKARVTIPKWLQRGVMDNLDSVMATLIHASMQLTIKKHSQRSANDHENPNPVVETASGQFRARSESPEVHSLGSQQVAQSSQHSRLFFSQEPKAS
ncbi:uncharacterized protein DEA37_0009795 [Paragonimus westermani]|uniref:Bridge-like lipid transfer protein family member 1 C-terminal domain-containing protein n=1 Tax=Paragonimus westermani TaxID=34504 RepID=A0A5J4NFK7_9TREM|nr:uncharacterized protein DEA37_0009795 [Paragonimus westermani]